jgi:hypothetical protein
MNSLNPATGSRRFFLKECLLTAGAVATGGGFLQHGLAREKGPLDQVRKVNVEGLRPAEHVLGPIIVSVDEYEYLIFDNVQTGRVTRANMTGGIGVVRLTQCVTWKTRTPGDEAFAEHPVDMDKLAECQTYSVVNSTWIKQLVKEDPELVGPHMPALHHLIFTFAENSFECVVAKIDAIKYPKSFADLHDYLRDS